MVIIQPITNDLKLVKKWSDTKKIDDAEIKHVLLNMLFCASYQPDERELLHNWWKSMTKKNQK
jgi:hypothetical protein